MPTLLHSHLLFCHHTAQQKKAKESASQQFSGKIATLLLPPTCSLITFLNLLMSIVFPAILQTLTNKA